MRRIVPIALVLAVALGGCTFLRKDEDALAAPPDPPEQASYLKETGVRPDEEAASPTAVESALAWSEKYSRAVEQLSRQQQEAHKLAEEKRQLNQKIAALEAELAQTRQELQEANDLLLDVRRANQRWKTDVLGYRDELRQAHEAELTALYKVLRLLGGEVPASTPTAGPADQAPPEASADATADATAAGPEPEGDTGASSD